MYNLFTMENEVTKQNEELVEEKKISRGQELLRFIITGLVCAILDYLVDALVSRLISGLGLPEFLAAAIPTTCGFLVGVTLNYILSTFWVFKNVKDEKKTKTVKFITIFVILGAVAWGLSIGIKYLGFYVCNNAWNIDIKNIDLLNLIRTFSFWGDATFWAFSIVFCIRTLVGLIWNYFTRKYILYK